jgi:hypothetical protein
MPCQQAPIHREKKAPAFFPLNGNGIGIHFRRVCIYSSLASQDYLLSQSARSVAMIGCGSAEKILPNLAISCSN